jgi:5-methyltetrahydrofolate--homocysteine methyltransferase
MATIQTLLDESRYLLADGAMGTMLFSAGLGQGDPPEQWNLIHPDRVTAVHCAYLDAGAQILLTNTFGGNRFRLSLHGLENQTDELNRAAAGLARQASDSLVSHNGSKALVAGDIGPTGQVLLPYGTMTFEEAREGFAEQALALIEGGVDLIWIETMSDLKEVQAAVEAVRQISSDIPIITTMTFDTHGRTMMGVTPEKAVVELSSLGPVAVGGNCGNGPEEIITVVEKMRAVTSDAILVAKSNAGIPELIKGRTVYRATPEDMADYAVKAFQAGARIIGACCGSTPDHVRAIAKALEAND